MLLADINNLHHVDDPMVLSFAELLDKGRDPERVQPELLEERRTAIEPRDTAILFYTSGTTGQTKGVMQSHRSLLDGIEPLVSPLALSGEDESLCYGALSHMSKRLFSLLMSLRCGHVVNFAERPETVFHDLPEVAPTVFFGVPRIFEKLKARIDIDIEEATLGKRQAYRLALRIGYRRCREQLLEVYGMTETGVTAWTPEDGVRLGKMGLPLEGTLVMATGRNVVPANLENMLKASDYILDSVVIGDQRPFLTALIVLDEETVSHYAQRHDVPFAAYADLAGHADIVHLIHSEVQRVNKRWSDHEQIDDFRILAWELSSDDELTPTMKVRLSCLCAQYAELIEEMYAAPDV